MRSRPPRNEKPLHWMASSKRDLLQFPDRVVDDIGYALGVAQLGGHPPSAKPWKGLGPGVAEIVEDDAAGLKAAKRDYEARYGKEED
jgi:phage-related protein